MLLRSSRKATQLTKEAGLLGGAARLGAKGITNFLGRVGQFGVKHPRAALGISGGGTAAIVEGGRGFQAAQAGLDPTRQALARAGYIPHAAPLPQGGWNFLKTRQELADQIRRVSRWSM